jgi:Tfp pilus assembly protein PilF
LLAAVALGALCGCETWGLGLRPDDAELVTTLPAEAAAWIAAETARGCFPAADPMPRHRDAPVARGDGQRFVIHYARDGRGSYRVRMNGRMMPPAALAQGAVCSLDGAAFQPGGPLTRAAEDAVDAAAIAVESSGGGARLIVRVQGEAVATRLAERLASALHLAEAVHHTAQLLDARRHRDAAASADAALTERGGGAIALHVLLRARLNLHLALAQAADDRLAEARRTVARALADDPDCRAAHLLRVRLDARTASVGNLGRHLQALSSVPGEPELAHAAGVQSLLAQPRGAADRADELRAQALSWLARGDVTAAFHWIRRARAAAPPSARTLEVLAEVYRRLDRRREARDTALLELAVHGFRPELVLALHDDCVAIGEVEPGLRWLARHWSDLRGAHRGEARRRILADASRTGTDLALRVLLSEHEDPHQFDDLLRGESAAGASDTVPASPGR